MKTLAHDLPQTKVEKAYGYWAWIYDGLCGPIFRPAHLAITAAANRIGGQALEVGVGTGLLLPLYRRDMSVTGLDISEQMLARARARLGHGHLPQVVALETGDIHTIGHPDQSYDVIALPFVLTLLSAPERALDNCRRMLRPGGEVIIVSHFQSEAAWIASAERWIAPRIASLGLRPDFPVERVRAWADRYGDLEMLPPEPVGALRIYTLLRIRKHASSGSIPEASLSKDEASPAPAAV
ncbi:MAG: class I SAM-dependent methyltransferase [Methylocystis sp.]|nr:class I SAM-dependent methyltransferase [Methylocystis sp.]MCA3584817.1 class I SAM-dependent methyltransferase [Methylocystis sp.]MCA3587516.1 class I SAM-dependent methyltransferase [Methylocystis sp.]MCA3593012.1 class I SAM-dependent methyltransferase [Methylocystis sp.]